MNHVYSMILIWVVHVFSLIPINIVVYASGANRDIKRALSSFVNKQWMNVMSLAAVHMMEIVDLFESLLSSLIDSQFSWRRVVVLFIALPKNIKITLLRKTVFLYTFYTISSLMIQFSTPYLQNSVNQQRFAIQYSRNGYNAHF